MRYLISVLALLQCSVLVVAQTPLQIIEKVADKVIANTPFNYKLVPNQPPKQFDFIQFVDFGRTFGKGRPASAYAYTLLESEKDTTITLDISHNDAAKVWVNGKLVYEKSGNQPVQFTQRERDWVLQGNFTFRANKGTNALLLFSETSGKDWITYLQPKNATTEFSEVKGLKLAIDLLPGTTKEVASLSNWLVAGPLDRKTQPNANLAKEFAVGQMFAGLDGNTTWGIPRVEVFGNVTNAHPLWGSFYNYNYHTAGLAWAFGNLSEYAGQPRFNQHAIKYCDFILETRPFVEYQVKTLNGFRSVHHHLINTPLLDFTSAPALPFIYRLIKQPDFANRKEYAAFVYGVQTYLQKDQVRLQDGTFTRETPEEYTTWVDDMFMGIPFVVHSALLAKDPVEKKKWFDEAVKQVIGFNKAVYDPTMNLYMHAQYSNRKAKLPYWSRANGWGVFAATVVLEHLPKNHPGYKTVMDIYRKHITAVASYQNAKGFYHQLLNDPNSYEEVSGTGIFTMAIAKGVNKGWLDAKKFRPIAEKGWNAIKTQIEPDGTVHNICIGTMSSEDPGYYKTRPLVDDDSHGLLGLVFCAIEMDKLLKK